MRKIGALVLLLMVSLACNNVKNKQEATKPMLTVSILPQKYFVEKLLGDHFNINVMIPPGASPVTYEPTPKQMKEVSKSDVYIRIGHIEFEKAWMQKIKSINSEMNVIDQSLNSKLISSEHDHESENHDSHYHHHGIDPHIWTSPVEVKTQMEVIYNYFVDQYPELKEDLTNNYKDFNEELDSLDNFLIKILKPYQGRNFLIFHPALSYIARDYGLNQISIEIDGKEPTPANIKEVIDLAKKEEVKVVFIQQQFSTHNAEVIAKEIKGKVVQIDPLSYQWNESIRYIATQIANSYSNHE